MKILLTLFLGLTLFGSDYAAMKASFDKGDINRAISITRTNAMRGNIPAMYDLGLLYYAKGDVKKAKTWLERSVRNDGKGELGLAILYFDSARDKKGYERVSIALINTPKTALSNSLMAVSKDLSSARDDASAEDYLRVAELFVNDKIIYSNMQRGLFLTTRAAKKGSDRAMEIMGDAYWRSIYTQDSYMVASQTAKGVEVALQYYKDASAHGNSEAMAKLGKLLLIGPYYLIDVRQGVTYILKSAENGSALGAKMAAELYMNGQGVRANRQQALEWYLKATDICDVNNILANMYGQGDEAKVYAKAFDTCTKEGSIKRRYHILFEEF